MKCRKKILKWGCIIAMCACLLYLLVQGFNYYLAVKIKPLSINEVCPKNESAIADANGKYYDYIEIYNASDRTISLQGYGLTDDVTKPYKYTFSNETLLLSKHRLLVYATNKGKAANTYYTGYTLDADEENTLYLTDNQGKLLDEIFIPKLKQDIAYGRYPDGTDTLATLLPSPGSDNTSTGIYVDVEEPTFSVPGGFCSEGTKLKMSTVDTSVKIFYTMDNTEPDEQSIQYTEEVNLKNPSLMENIYHNYINVTKDYTYVPSEEPIDKAVILKAIAIDNQGNKSDIVTNTYFVDLAEKDQYQDGLMISITTDPDNLFDDEKGIYVTGSNYDKWYKNGKEGETPITNYELRGEESERPAYLEIYNQESESLTSQNIGIRIQGASTRQSPKKRFSLFSRKDYGTGKFFNYNFWGNGIKTHSLVLRTNFVDAFVQSFMENSETSIQRGELAHVFLEGEYWWDYYLQEKYSDDYIEQYYQVDHDNVVLYKNSGIEVGTEQDEKTFYDFYNYITWTDMSDQENYEKACTLMDMKSYIDYVSAQVYFCNMDWNYSKMLCWRARDVSQSKYEDGRWRFMLYDCDCLSWRSALIDTCNVDHVAQIDSFSVEMPYLKGTVLSDPIFSSLIKNESFRKEFADRFTELCNTTFSYENVSKKMKEWRINDEYYDTFFKERKEYILKYMQEDFEKIE